MTVAIMKLYKKILPAVRIQMDDTNHCVMAHNNRKPSTRYIVLFPLNDVRKGLSKASKRFQTFGTLHMQFDLPSRFDGSTPGFSNRQKIALFVPFQEQMIGFNIEDKDNLSLRIQELNDFLRHRHQEYLFHLSRHLLLRKLMKNVLVQSIK